MTTAAYTGLIFGIITAFINLTLGFIVFKKDPRNLKNIFLALFIVVFGVGAQVISSVIILSGDNFPVVFTTYRLGAVPYFGSFPIFYLFSRYYLGIKKEIYNLVLLGLITLICFGAALFAPQLLFNITFDQALGYYILHFDSNLMRSLMTAGLYLFIVGEFHFFAALHREKVPVERNRLYYLSVGPIFSFLGIFILFIPSFHILPWDMIGITITSLILSYAVLKHELLNIQIVIRQSLVYTVITGIIMLLFTALGFIFPLFGLSEITAMPVQIMLVSAVIIAFVIQYLYFNHTKILNMLEVEQEMNRKTGETLVMAAHQLRTPLTLISGNLDNILEGYGSSKLSANDSLVVRNTIEVSDRLIIMVDNFLRAAELDSHKVIINPQPLDSDALVKKVIEELKSRAEIKKVELIFDCHAEHGPALTDKDKTKDILVNLIDNCLKYTKVGKITIEHKLEADMLITSVSDTGMGIAKDSQKLLFYRYGTLPQILQKSTEGAGLGLYLSREFARLMGGDLWLVDSQTGKGSTFAFSLPLKK